MAAFSTLGLALLAAQTGTQIYQGIKARRQAKQQTDVDQPLQPPKPPVAPNPFPLAQLAASRARQAGSGYQKTRTRTQQRQAAAKPLAGGANWADTGGRHTLAY